MPLVRIDLIRGKSAEYRKALGEIVKTLVTILCAALIAASSIQAAAAAEHHHTRKASRKPVVVYDQYRNSNNQLSRDSNVSGTCGLFPGPCQ